MKIGGIVSSNKGRGRRGDPIPLEPEKKVKFMARQGVISKPPEGYRYIPCRMNMRSKVDVFQGRKEMNEPSQYGGIVEVIYRPLRLKDDRLFPEQSAIVKIRCEDSKDDIGIDDLKILDFKVLQ
ncbi:MAG: hypothetical protein DRQ88_13035 [Epsilonproteobacteria bacterium]|nr:MAG: hypothetical protein DRQ88_13035 [Campylobacterota bacterium]